MARNQSQAVAVVVALAALAGGAYWAVHTGVGPLPNPEGCTAKANSHATHVDLDQAENAAIVEMVAEQRGLPARAVSIAYTTALQESKLRNLDHGDRDSLGLFQQRSSQGWGRPAQIMNPAYAAGAFFDALVKVDRYQTRDIGQVAQAVQRSGYPGAYDDHITDGRTLASAFTGYSAAGFSCVVHPQSVTTQRPASDGLVARARTLRGEVRRAYGGWLVANATSATGLRLSVGSSADRVRRGWVVATYLMANAKRLQIASIGYDDSRWRAGSASEHGWQRTPGPSVGAGGTVSTGGTVITVTVLN